MPTFQATDKLSYVHLDTTCLEYFKKIQMITPRKSITKKVFIQQRSPTHGAQNTHFNLLLKP